MNENQKAAIAEFIQGFKVGVYARTPELSAEEATELAGQLIMKWADDHAAS